MYVHTHYYYDVYHSSHTHYYLETEYTDLKAFIKRIFTHVRPYTLLLRNRIPRLRGIHFILCPPHQVQAQVWLAIFRHKDKARERSSQHNLRRRRRCSRQAGTFYKAKYYGMPQTSHYHPFFIPKSGLSVNLTSSRAQPMNLSAFQPYLKSLLGRVCSTL